MNKVQLLFVALVLCLASAKALGQKEPRIANEGTIGDKWMLADGTTLATATYPPAFASQGENVCIALGYLIAEDGGTSDFRVLKQWRSGSGEQEPADGFWKAFAQASADTVSQWRFKPRPEVEVARPTYTVATLGFNGSKDANLAGVLAHCKTTDLAGLLQRIKSEDYRRGDVIKHEQEIRRMRQQNQQQEERFRNANPSGG